MKEEVKISNRNHPAYLNLFGIKDYRDTPSLSFRLFQKWEDSMGDLQIRRSSIVRKKVERFDSYEQAEITARKYLE
jgi:hypothetical protein